MTAKQIWGTKTKFCPCGGDENFHTEKSAHAFRFGHFKPNGGPMGQGPCHVDVVRISLISYNLKSNPKFFNLANNKA
jgi:hypothetical protein